MGTKEGAREANLENAIHAAGNQARCVFSLHGDSNNDFADAMLGFVNFVMNERVRCHNEGVDAERARCRLLKVAVKDLGGKSEEWLKGFHEGTMAVLDAINAQ